MDEITNAILTNPDLLARAQGKDMRLKCVWRKWDGTDMLDIECGNDTWVIAKHLIMPDEKNYYVISAELLKSDTRFCDSPVVKAYLETLYH